MYQENLLLQNTITVRNCIFAEYVKSLIKISILEIYNFVAFKIIFLFKIQFKLDTKDYVC